jgi:hypothetical protein
MSPVWTPAPSRVEPLADGAIIHIARNRDEVRRVVDSIRLGPNEVHAFITHADGSIDDLGIAHNLLTTVGRDLEAAAVGHSPGQSGVLTGATATSATKTAAG